jgi:hypothetical protein
LAFISTQAAEFIEFIGMQALVWMLDVHEMVIIVIEGHCLLCATWASGDSDWHHEFGVSACSMWVGLSMLCVSAVLM